MKIEEVLKKMSDLGCHKYLIKKLSTNDNSKNQVYLGGEQGLQYLPFVDSQLIKQTSKKKNASDYIFRNILKFNWLTETGVHAVPEAKAIFYPQYPETRFSGFLQGCKEAPREIIAGRHENRFLILSFNNKNESFGYVSFIDEDFISFMEQNFEDVNENTFFEGVILSERSTEITTPSPVKAGLEKSIWDIKQAIKKICNKDWIKAKKLQKDGSIVEHNKVNAGGVTLESELGVLPNSDAAPDYMGWEIKQHSGSNRPVTLFTPEPDAGFYKENGIAEFIRNYGYPDKKGRENRFNFGGVHRVTDTDFHNLTNLRLIIHGYSNGNFTKEDGHIGLQTPEGETVAIWTFTKLLQHWQRKHAKTCFVKSERREEGETYFFKYSPDIDLGIESTFINFLKLLEEGKIYYDPGSKLFLENGKWKTKARSQFRIKSSELHLLYKRYISINVFE